MQPGYNQRHSREPSPAPPYDGRTTRSLIHNEDPFQTTRHLAYGPSGPTFPAFPVEPPSRYAATSPPIAVRHPTMSMIAHESENLSTPSRLPFFEAALARSRGESIAPTQPTFAIPNNPPFRQPLPVYLPPPDPNHPDLAAGFTQSSTVRFAPRQGARPTRGMSRSPSPGFDDYSEHGYNVAYDYSGEKDIEKALLSDETVRSPGQSPADQAAIKRGWSEKLSSFGLTGAMDEGDLSLPPFHGTMHNVSSTLPSIHLRGPTASTTDSQSFGVVDGELALSATQHFGPAPSGRVGRRTHNAAGHRRIKQTATLDDNGFFAVDMPIPTRLAQFLPVKGVEEQKSTR